MYRVVVGNIGTVYEGTSKQGADETYNKYMKMSKTGRGRCGFESIIVICGDDVILEYNPDVIFDA